MRILNKNDLKNKKVLVVGLGLLGGGIAATKWLVKHGAKVTVTDLKTGKELASSIKLLGAAAKKIGFVLGKHRESDFKNNEIVVVNPAVPRESKFLKIARENGTQIENEASLFFRFCKNPVIAVTGTRGKTTTVNWIHHFLKRKHPKAILTGNSSDNPMLNVLDKLDGKSPVVVELSSWHLEILPQAKKAPRIAVVTNIYADHLNRYRNIKDYASAKANIFKHQTRADFLILNKNNPWTKFFLSKKPKSRIFYFPIKLGLNKKAFIKKYGVHNLENLSAAVLAAKLAGVPWGTIKKAINSLPQVRFREEIIYQTKKFNPVSSRSPQGGRSRPAKDGRAASNGVKIINDSTATSPDATIAALKRFRKDGEIILIAGGTDKKLQFSEWAGVIKKCVKPKNLFLLNGTATKKMLAVLGKSKYFKNAKSQLFEDLLVLLKQVKRKLPITSYKLPRPTSHGRSPGGRAIIVLFSPGAASFEKFKNEFDRGEKFNLYFKKIFPREDLSR